MAMIRLAAATNKSLVQWIDTRRFQVRITPVNSVNHLLEIIHSRQTDYLAIDPTWLPMEWFSPVIGLAISNEINIILLTDHIQAKTWQVVPWVDQEHFSPVKSNCLVVDWETHTAWHQGTPLDLPKRAQEFLLLIQSYSNDLWTMDRLNALAPQHGIEPFTKGSLQWVIHTVREHLGPRHIQRVRRVGYRFYGCQPLSD